MDEAKKKQIEEKLRQLLTLEDLSRNESRPAFERKASGPLIIRRRKGAADRKIA